MNTETGRRSRRGGAALAVSVVLMAAACGGDAPNARRAVEKTAARADASAGARVPEAVQRLDIDGTEYAFAIEPDPADGLAPGWTEVRFRNRGGEAHQIMFARLKDGVDLAELAAAGAGDSSGAAAIEFVDMLGGVSYIGPGQEIRAMIDLPAGTVLGMCYVPDPDGVAHALSGMSTTLSVGDAATTKTSAPGTDGAASTPRGRVEGTITLGPDGYEIPRPLRRGWYHVVNTDVGPPGTGLHELAIMRLGRALSPPALETLLGDIAANKTPEVRLDALGGLGAISPGFDGYVYLDLPRGNYLAVDFMPDAGNPRPHLLDGYVATFRV